MSISGTRTSAWYELEITAFPVTSTWPPTPSPGSMT